MGGVRPRDWGGEDPFERGERVGEDHEGGVKRICGAMGNRLVRWEDQHCHHKRSGRTLCWDVDRVSSCESCKVARLQQSGQI